MFKILLFIIFEAVGSLSLNKGLLYILYASHSLTNLMSNIRFYHAQLFGVGGMSETKIPKINI